MKKSIFASAIALIITGSAFAQPVSDRAVIPMGVTCVQVLRIHVTNGGNIEFVFNSIADYKNGITNSSFYDSDFTVASSTDWTLHMGAEDATFLGTDNVANILGLTNVGFLLTETGAYGTPANFLPGLGYATAFATVTALKIYTGAAASDGLIIKAAAATNAGDALDNIFTLNWECGTQQGNMNAQSMLTVSPVPDRYVTNILLELEAN